MEVPALIVGGGPVGLMGALLLARRGVRSLLVEKHASRLDAPKAHALNPRSLEICAAAGLPMAALHAVATRPEEGAVVRMVTSLAGEEFGCLTYERQDEAVRELTPWPLINIAQPDFENIVEQAVSQLPGIDLRRGMEWTGCSEEEGGLLSTLVRRGTGETIQVRSRYLIAADGAGSGVREHLGIAMEGAEALQHNMMIHFEADLRAQLAGRPAILYFLFGPGRSRALIAYDIGRTWVLMHPCAPEAQLEDFDEATCRELIRAALGFDAPGLKIRNVRRWVMSAQVAGQYRKGNAFLAGDAAHRFPPSGGLGLNTGIGDIDNLTWKIAACEAGVASAGLLETYEAERKPIAEANMRQSVHNSRQMRRIAEALGYGPDGEYDGGRIAARLAEPESRARITEAVLLQKDHFDSLRLQLGFIYGAADADAGLSVGEFKPRAVAGARLPHLALADGRSSLDLVSISGFTLLAGAHSGWKSLCAGLGVPVACVSPGADFPERMGLGPEGALLVRPDGHILAIARDASASSVGRLREALGSYLVRGKAAHFTEETA